MKYLARLFAVTLFGAAIAGAPIMAQTVTIDYDHTVNFLKFKTYTWGKVHATDPSVEARITLALNRDMAGRYMTEVAKDSDVTITAVEANEDKKEISSFYDSSVISPGSARGAQQASSTRRPPSMTSLSTPWSLICTTPRPTNCCGAASFRSLLRMPPRRKPIRSSTRPSRN